MPAYWVARAKVNDPVEYKKYADRVPAIFAKYGAKVLTRGGRYQTLEGQEKFNRFVVIEFPSFEQGVACFYSQEYREAAAFRRRNKAGENELVMIEAGARRDPNDQAKYVGLTAEDLRTRVRFPPPPPEPTAIQGRAIRPWPSSS